MNPTFAILLVVLSLCSAEAFAAGDSCKKVSALAAQAMAARQDGKLLEDSLESIGDGSKFAQKMILKAYDQPVMTLKTMKEGSVKEFQNDAYRECLEANS